MLRGPDLTYVTNANDVKEIITVLVSGGLTL